VAVDARQHDVEHDEIGRDPGAQLDAAQAVAGDLDGEALGAQARGERLGDRRLVLHDDDRRGWGALHEAHAKPRSSGRVGDRVQML
jgi:hypothetical protein